MLDTILRGRKAIICEGEGLPVTILTLALRRMGAEQVKAFKHCEDAVEAVRAEMPHLVLMDVYPGDENGIEAALMVKKLRDTCVIAIIPRKDPDLITRALAAGIDGYLVKPFYSDDILDVLRKTCCFGASFKNPN